MLCGWYFSKFTIRIDCLLNSDSTMNFPNVFLQYHPHQCCLCISQTKFVFEKSFFLSVQKINEKIHIKVMNGDCNSYERFIRPINEMEFLQLKAVFNARFIFLLFCINIERINLYFFFSSRNVLFMRWSHTSGE